MEARSLIPTAVDAGADMAKCADPGEAIDRARLSDVALWVSLRGWSEEFFDDLERLGIAPR